MVKLISIVNIDFQKKSHRKMKKSDHKLHFDHKLNRFFDHKLDTPLYLTLEVTYNISLETPSKKWQNSNFLNIHQIEK